MRYITFTYWAVLFLGLAGCSQATDSTIYVAAEVVTLDKNSKGSAILVEDDRIIALGEVNELQTLNPMARLETALENAVVVPGLIDPHIHMILGALIYSRPFIPPWDMQTPEGLVKGVSNKNAFLQRLKEVHDEQLSGDPLIVYGYHNLIHGDLEKEDIDTVSATRPIFIWHYSGHDFYLNSAALKWSDITPATADEVEGVALDNNGELTGRIYEHASLYLFESLATQLLTPGNIGKGYSGFERMLERSGVTTVAELGYGLFGKNLEDFYHFLEYTKEDRYTLYMVPEHRAFYKKYGDKSHQKVMALADRDTSHGDPIVLPQVKFFTDAAFYSQTMRMTQPGYIGGQSEGTVGIWATQPDVLKDQILPYWKSGIEVRIHSNGDAAQDVTLETMMQLAYETGDTDVRFVIEHAGIMRPDHLELLASMNGGISAASHYVHYMGDDYRAALGDRVKYITPLNSAAKLNIPITLHSDAPLAPPEPLRAASAHMLRSTRGGGVSTPSERLGAEDALASITIHAAWALGLENELGTITPGKRANFTVLERNPLTTPAEQWPNIGVQGVVLNGKWLPLTK